MRNRLNLTTAGTTTFRYLAYAGAAGGILGFIAAPAKNTSLLVLALIVWALVLVAVLGVLFFSRPYKTGNVPTLTFGRPTKIQMTVLKIMMLGVLVPMSSDWSFQFSVLIGLGLILSGLAALIGLAYGLGPDRPDTRARRHHAFTPAGRLATTVGGMIENSRPPLPRLSSGEIAAHADLFGRKGKIRVDRAADTVTVSAEDGYRAIYKLSDGTPLGDMGIV